jgi:hypothetical protein
MKKKPLLSALASAALIFFAFSMLAFPRSIEAKSGNLGTEEKGIEKKTTEKKSAGKKNTEKKNTEKKNTEKKNTEKNSTDKKKIERSDAEKKQIAAETSEINAAVVSANAGTVETVVLVGRFTKSGEQYVFVVEGEPNLSGEVMPFFGARGVVFTLAQPYPDKMMQVLDNNVRISARLEEGETATFMSEKQRLVDAEGRAVFKRYEEFVAPAILVVESID